jgi:hypothetical protein
MIHVDLLSAVAVRSVPFPELIEAEAGGWIEKAGIVI